MGFLGRMFGGSGDGNRGVYERCGWCGTGILYGEKSVAVALSTERAEEASVNVLDAEALLVLCEPCGSRLDARALQRALDGLRPGRDRP